MEGEEGRPLMCTGCWETGGRVGRGIEWAMGIRVGSGEGGVFQSRAE